MVAVVQVVTESTAARIIARTASGSLGHAVTSRANSGSISRPVVSRSQPFSAVSVATFCATTLRGTAFSSGFSQFGSGLQIRHRRFDSDQRLSESAMSQPASCRAGHGAFVFREAGKRSAERTMRFAGKDTFGDYQNGTPCFFDIFDRIDAVSSSRSCHNRSRSLAPSATTFACAAWTSAKLFLCCTQFG